MRWRRIRPGLYTAGPWRVERTDRQLWRVSGPGIPEERSVSVVKSAAQDRALCAALRRVLESRPEPVIGDHAAYQGKEWEVSAIFPQYRNDAGQLYCLRRNNVRRTALRDEFVVVIP